MKKNVFIPLFICVIAFVQLSCKKETEVLSLASYNAYYPLQVGKMFVYRCDSTVPCCFNANLIIKSYLVKDTVESTFNDNEGRFSYRIFRYLRDTAELTPWTFAYTFYATPTGNNVEYVEDNFRFIKLQNPVANNISWKGNRYINTSSFDYLYLDNWDYSYQNIDNKFVTRGITYDSTVTISQVDEFDPDGPFDPNLSYQQRNFSTEVYAKGIGLVYKELLHWVWQGNAYEDGAYGVKLSLIKHN